MSRVPVLLACGGLDPLGHAGLAADLRAGAALGVLVAPVAAVLTVQDGRGVQRVEGVDPVLLEQQLRAVLSTLTVGAVKLGLLAGAPQVRAVARVLADYKDLPVVLDPVLGATLAGSLVHADLIPALKEGLFARADVITPNLPEASLLLGADVPPGQEPQAQAAARLRALGARAVLLKGGHAEGDYSSDYLCDPHGGLWLEAKRLQLANTRGTGCTLATLLACLLGQGQPLRAAAIGAKDALGHLLRKGASTEWSHGAGPVGV